MKLYRVHHADYGGLGSAGFSWHTSKRGAEKAEREGGADSSIELVEINPTKAGILKLLNRYADHPDNG